jgi:hypothetical protein
MGDEVCAVCQEPIEPGTFPQLQFDGTWVCQQCVAPTAVPAPKEDREYER